MGHRRTNSEPDPMQFATPFQQEAIKVLNAPIDDDDDDDGAHMLVQKQSSADWPEVLHSISQSDPPSGAPIVDPSEIRWDDPSTAIHLPPPVDHAFVNRKSEGKRGTVLSL